MWPIYIGSFNYWMCKRIMEEKGISRFEQNLITYLIFSLYHRLGIASFGDGKDYKYQGRASCLLHQDQSW
jgi:hypothetical protein